MQQFFDIDRWKIDLGPGKPPIAHYAMHCLYPVELPAWILYVRLSRQAQLVARKKSDNSEVVLNLPGGTKSGLVHLIDGATRVAFAWPNTQDKPPPYDSRDVLMAIFDDGVWKAVAGRKYRPLGDSDKPNILWIFKTTGGDISPNDPYALPRSLRFISPTLFEFGAIAIGTNGLVNDHIRYQRSIDLVTGDCGPLNAVEHSVQVPTWL